MGLKFFSVLSLCLAVVAVSAPVAAYDKDYIGEQIVYKAAYEDTFVHLARDYNLGFVELRAANPHIDPWIPGAGTEIILPLRHLLPDAPRAGIVINLPEMRLYAYGQGEGGAPVSFPLGIGREGLETPEGTTEIVRKAYLPEWRPTQRMREEDPDLPEVVFPGDDNPLGTHALYLGWPLYAIHGTNRPFGIGRRVSSGCIRMYPEAIVKFHEMIDVGTSVTVVNQPLKLGWIDDVLYLEAHPTLDQALAVEEQGLVRGGEMSDTEKTMIEAFAGKSAQNIDWSVVENSLSARSGLPVKIAARYVPPPEGEGIMVAKADDISGASEAAQVKGVKPTAPVAAPRSYNE